MEVHTIYQERGCCNTVFKYQFIKAARAA
uniref:Uncharacterized protein n=1 Tax=Arundo donax TaxID=35708 RepID=A0A0A9H103_ARUDO